MAYRPPNDDNVVAGEFELWSFGDLDLGTFVPRGMDLSESRIPRDYSAGSEVISSNFFITRDPLIAPLSTVTQSGQKPVCQRGFRSPSGLRLMESDSALASARPYRLLSRREEGAA
jgi:hypothetical protein